MFQPLVRDPSLTSQTAAEIQRGILEHLKAGDRLPPERQLAETLGVSRTVIREAIRLLAARGLVDVRTGSGTYVRGLGAELVSEPMNLLLQAGSLRPEDIHEVRSELEVRIAGLAAMRAQEDDYTRMEESVEALRRPNLPPAEYADAEVAFHTHLAGATRNPLFSVLLKSLNAVLTRSREIAFSDQETRDSAIAFHRRILGRLKAKDSDGARQAMDEHLAVARKYCSGVKLLSFFASLLVQEFALPPMLL